MKITMKWPQIVLASVCLVLFLMQLYLFFLYRKLGNPSYSLLQLIGWAAFYSSVAFSLDQPKLTKLQMLRLLLLFIAISIFAFHLGQVF